MHTVRKYQSLYQVTFLPPSELLPQPNFFLKLLMMVILLLFLAPQSVTVCGGTNDDYYDDDEKIGISAPGWAYIRHLCRAPPSD